ncbi:hypothetical protein G9A89_010421 [Geosiphon pyriformis]|nr:hypothetical protein G9A89_010421 [Geosiphon pyriformis]
MFTTHDQTYQHPLHRIMDSLYILQQLILEKDHPNNSIPKYCEAFLYECDMCKPLNNYPSSIYNEYFHDDDDEKSEDSSSSDELYDEDYEKLISHIQFYRGMISKLFKEEYLPDRVICSRLPKEFQAWKKSKKNPKGLEIKVTRHTNVLSTLIENITPSPPLQTVPEKNSLAIEDDIDKEANIEAKILRRKRRECPMDSRLTQQWLRISKYVPPSSPHFPAYEDIKAIALKPECQVEEAVKDWASWIEQLGLVN